MRPFLIAIKLDFLADIYTWILLFAGVRARRGTGCVLLRADRARRLASSVCRLSGFGAAAGYRFVLVPHFPALWPRENAPLLLSVILFALMGLIFARHTLVLALGPKHVLSGWLIQPKSGALLVYVQSRHCRRRTVVGFDQQRDEGAACDKAARPPFSCDPIRSRCGAGLRPSSGAAADGRATLQTRDAGGPRPRDEGAGALKLRA